VVDWREVQSAVPVIVEAQIAFSTIVHAALGSLPERS
jgi:hypothetical protein